MYLSNYVLTDQTQIALSYIDDSTEVLMQIRTTYLKNLLFNLIKTF